VASIQASATVKQKAPDGLRCLGCQQRDTIIDDLKRCVRDLRQRLRDTRRQLRVQQERSGRNSSNSSIPPSSNPVDAPQGKNTKKPSGRKPGGQPGHPPTNPGLFPLEDLTEPPLPCIPETCEHCQAALSSRDNNPACHQVIELPFIDPEIREYQRHGITCTRCGHLTWGQLPDGIPSGNYGPRLQAFIALCTGCYHLSKRQVEELLSTTLDIPISLGTICNIEQRVSAAVAEPVAEAKRHLQQAAVVHADETSWPQQPDKSWLWVGVINYLAVFSIRNLRDLVSAQDLLGADFAGILVSDRFSSYDWVGNRQFCWAHLRRDWQAFIDRGGGSRRIGRQLRELTDQMFHLWHRVRDGTLSRHMFRFYMIDIRNDVGDCLRSGAACAHSRTAGTCAEILRREDALWTFVNREGVEPTNNAAERVLRQAVLWRKKSFGTRGLDGSRFVERLLTVVATCRLLDRNVLEYLTSACIATACRQPAPSLLPSNEIIAIQASPSKSTSHRHRTSS
jgi:transposase